MSNVTVIINGLAIQTVLEELDGRIETVGQFIENKAKENMEGHNKSGILRASINHTDPVEHKVVIGTNVEYAIPFHEGHGAWHGHPFLKDAAYNHISEIKNILGGR